MIYTRVPILFKIMNTLPYPFLQNFEPISLRPDMVNMKLNPYAQRKSHSKSIISTNNKNNHSSEFINTSHHHGLEWFAKNLFQPIRTDEHVRQLQQNKFKNIFRSRSTSNANAQNGGHFNSCHRRRQNVFLRYLSVKLGIYIRNTVKHSQ